MSPRRPSRRQSGFTLVETLAATAVFVIGVLGFMGAMVAARGSTSWARRDMEASALAADLAGQIELWDYTDPRLSATTGAPCATDPADTAGALLEPGTGGYSGFVGCAHKEADLRAYLGRSNPSFPVSTGVSDTFTRLWVVREEDAAGGVPANAGASLRKRIWVLVAYKDGEVGRRIVSYQAKVKREALR
jgi:prepilin-type N-terminal cleavage/methylation domain-containing protein